MLQSWHKPPTPPLQPAWPIAPGQRICKLQINQAGAWRDVVRFDADAHGEAIQQHAPLLAATVGATLRIVIADSLNTCLLRWSLDTGWVVA